MISFRDPNLITSANTLSPQTLQGHTPMIWVDLFLGVIVQPTAWLLLLFLQNWKKSWLLITKAVDPSFIYVLIVPVQGGSWRGRGLHNQVGRMNLHYQYSFDESPEGVFGTHVRKTSDEWTYGNDTLFPQYAVSCLKTQAVTWIRSWVMESFSAFGKVT